MIFDTDHPLAVTIVMTHPLSTATSIAAVVRGRATRMWSIATAVVALSAAFPLSTSAQDTRAEAIRQQQAEKQQQLAPPRPNAAERVIERLEEWGLIAGAPRGFCPWFGSVYSGGGVAGGLGVRKPFGDDGSVNVLGGYSISTFARAQADLELPTFARNHARIGFPAGTSTRLT